MKYSKVSWCVESIMRKQGKSKSTAIRICEKTTGLSYKTGRKLAKRKSKKWTFEKFDRLCQGSPVLKDMSPERQENEIKKLWYANKSYPKNLRTLTRFMRGFSITGSGKSETRLLSSARQHKY